MIEFTSTPLLDDHRCIGSRAVLGQAEGILMERFGVGAEQAYGYLRRESDDSGRELVHVAIEVVRTRESPVGCPR